MKWLQICVDQSRARGGFKNHICSEELCGGLVTQLAGRGAEIDEIRELEDQTVRFWLPRPGMADEGQLTSPSIHGLVVEVKATSFEYWLERVRAYDLAGYRTDLAVPSFKYHLSHHCLVVNVEQHQAILDWFELVQDEARVLAELEARRFNKAIQGLNPKLVQVSPKITDPVGEC